MKKKNYKPKSMIKLQEKRINQSHNHKAHLPLLINPGYHLRKGMNYKLPVNHIANHSVTHYRTFNLNDEGWEEEEVGFKVNFLMVVVEVDLCILQQHNPSLVLLVRLETCLIIKKHLFTKKHHLVSKRKIFSPLQRIGLTDSGGF